MKMRTIYSCFKEIADRHSHEPAIIEDDRTLSYDELDKMVDAIAAKFYDRHPTSVGIVMHHGAEQIAAMLAVLKSGAFYVPAEPSLPQERIDYMMQSAGVDFIINDNYCKHLQPTNRRMDDRSEPQGLAYVL